MSHAKLPAELRRRNPILYPAIFLAITMLPTACSKDEQSAAKTPAPATTVNVTQNASAPATPPASPLPPAAVAVKPLSDMESLLAPIALYSDPLLAELLVASTYPLEIVQAARWLETNPDLANVNSKDWDASIQRLTAVPSVVKMMNDHLDWTTQLGDAFLAKPTEMMDTIQSLRKRAKDAGFLKDTPEQKVTIQTLAVSPASDANQATAKPAALKKDVIAIAPAKPDTVFVPQYNPEVVYQAPMAPAPTTVVNVNSATPTAYYPTYYPAPQTTTSSDTWMNFASGALVGGLLTWGIMEWADDNDDWDDDYHHVSHYYGDSVCHNGNCWHGGGGYGDRGNFNYNKDINISGNDINIDRDGTFNQNNLRPAQRPAGWQPNPRHRRGQAYPAAVQQRLGASQQTPALARQRLGAAQTLPAADRGFGETRQNPAVTTLTAEHRPSSADIRQQLAQKPEARNSAAAKTLQERPATRDIQSSLRQSSPNNALQGIKTSGQAARLDSQRGASSRAAASPRPNPAQQPASQNRISNSQASRPRAEFPAAGNRLQAPANLNPPQRPFNDPRRSELARPTAFEGARNAGGSVGASQRGAASRAAGGGQARARAGGGQARVSGGGGGGGRRR